MRAQATESAEGKLYAERLRDSNIVSRIAAGKLTLDWVNLALIFSQD